MNKDLSSAARALFAAYESAASKVGYWKGHVEAADCDRMSDVCALWRTEVEKAVDELEMARSALARELGVDLRTRKAWL